MKKFLKVAAAALAMVMTLGLVGCSGGDKTASTKESSSSKTTSSQSSSKTTSSKQEDKFSVQSAKPADAQNPVVTITMQDGGVIKAELYPDIWDYEEEEEEIKDELLHDFEQMKRFYKQVLEAKGHVLVSIC